MQYINESIMWKNFRFDAFHRHSHQECKKESKKDIKKIIQEKNKKDKMGE